MQFEVCLKNILRYYFIVMAVKVNLARNLSRQLAEKRRDFRKPMKFKVILFMLLDDEKTKFSLF